MVDEVRRKMIRSGLAVLATGGLAGAAITSSPKKALASCTSCEPGCYSCPTECSQTCSTCSDSCSGGGSGKPPAE